MIRQDVVLVVALVLAIAMLALIWWCWPVAPKLRRAPRHEGPATITLPAGDPKGLTDKAEALPPATYESLPPIHMLPVPRSYAEAQAQRAPYIERLKREGLL